MHMLVHGSWRPFFPSSDVVFVLLVEPGVMLLVLTEKGSAPGESNGLALCKRN